MVESIETQINEKFNLITSDIQDLKMPTNDIFRISTQNGVFALKLYQRDRKGVEWEVEMINHLIEDSVKVSKPILGKNGYVNKFLYKNKDLVGVLYKWIEGVKPNPSEESYYLLGKSAGLIHKSLDNFNPTWTRDEYNLAVLVDEQVFRMRDLLIKAKRFEKVQRMSERLKSLITASLDFGFCHMDLTFDNVHVKGRELTVFDFDSSGKSWRALEAHKMIKLGGSFFQSWLKGYRGIREFSEGDEKDVFAFAIIGDLRVVAWDVGVAESSRGKPRLDISGLQEKVDEWLKWEKEKILYG